MIVIIVHAIDLAIALCLTTHPFFECCCMVGVPASDPGGNKVRNLRLAIEYIAMHYIIIYNCD